MEGCGAPSRDDVNERSVPRPALPYVVMKTRKDALHARRMRRVALDPVGPALGHVVM